MIVFKRFTDSDYIAMGKTDVWEISRVAEMVTWFSFQERAQLENLEKAVIYEDGENPNGTSQFKDPESKAFAEVMSATFKQFRKAYIDRNIEAIERLELKDFMEGRVGDTEYCVRKESALQFLEVGFRQVDVDKLRRVLSGELVAGRKDSTVENIVKEYGEQADPKAASRSMADSRHKKSERFKEALQTRIDDYFGGDCRCTSKTAFEEMKKWWSDEDEMKSDVKVGYYSLHQKIKATLRDLEESGPDKIVRRNQAEGYRKEKISDNCPKHRRTILK